MEKKQHEKRRHFCARCVHHWRGAVRTHNCGAGLDCREIAWSGACWQKREAQTR